MSSVAFCALEVISLPTAFGNALIHLVTNEKRRGSEYGVIESQSHSLRFLKYDITSTVMIKEKYITVEEAAKKWGKPLEMCV